MRQPLAALVGPHNCGKTGLLLRLLERGRHAGVQVGVIKWAARPLVFEQEGKDSARIAGAGARRVITVGPGALHMMEPHTARPSLKELVRMHGRGVDLWLVESFEPLPVPWLRVARPGQEPPAPDPYCFGAVGGGARAQGLPYFRADRPAVLLRFLTEHLGIT